MNPVLLRRRIIQISIALALVIALILIIVLSVVLTRDNGNDDDDDRASQPLATSSSSSSSSTSTSAAASFTGDLNRFEQDILDEHNRRRLLHSAQNLTWDPERVEFAVNYAAEAFDCDNVQLIHSEGPYGENLAAGYVGGIDPVVAWYDEIEMYDFDNPGFETETGHFTQLVWRNTSTIGCARVECDNSWRQYTICEYSESRGNIVGTNSSSGNTYFEDNVWPPNNE